MQKRLAQILLVMMLFNFLFESFAYAANNDETSEANLRMILQKYCPDGNYIVNEYEKAVNDKSQFKNYIEPGNVAGSINTIVHELNHGFTYKMPYKLLGKESYYNRYSAFYISNKEIILVKHTPVFNSLEIAKDIPQNLRTYRFGLYILNNDNTPNLGSQIEGIYGLLDEFNAYYQGTKAAYELYNYYFSKYIDNKTFDYFKGVYGTYTAYAEFKFFILKYLLYAKKYYPNIYNDIINNKEFKLAFNKIDKLYFDLISNIDVKKKVILYKYKNIYERNGGLWIGNKGISLKEYYSSSKSQLLINEMKKKDYVDILNELKNDTSNNISNNSAIKVIVNGKTINFDSEPIIKNGRTLVPVRAIFEALGATVTWDPESRMVTGNRGDIIIKLVIGQKKAYINDIEISLDVEPQIIKGRTLVPLRFISEALNCQVQWDERTRTVTINSN
ncbi:Copper amine oxidase N-terminal domain-containing protein (plasmid) [Carboxydocella thermautotrophica]|nr:Copper amine oxidase N-terminal domain-containing protein [Carboxydocella thermautotrophica]